MRRLSECRYCHVRIVGPEPMWAHVADEPTDHPAVPAREARQ